MNSLLVFTYLLSTTPWGHPLTERMFERTVEVTVTTSEVQVRYQLGLTELTLATELLTLAEPGQIPVGAKASVEFYRDLAAPILARGMILHVAGKELDLLPQKPEEPIYEQHVILSFVFRSPLPELPAEPVEFSFFDTNFSGERGYRRLAFRSEKGIEILHSNVVCSLDEALDIPTWEMTPEQELASYQIAASIQRTPSTIEATAPAVHSSAPTVPIIEDVEPPTEKPAELTESQHLRNLLGEASSSPWLWPAILATAFGFGMVHAIKPGHGKTLVAAYLVGQQGTIYHAGLLGIVTAATHTGSVLFVALLLRPFAGTRWVEQGTLSFWLTLVSGVLVMSLGATLFWRRMTGKEDLLHVHGEGGHIHLPDGGIQWLNDPHSQPHSHSHDHGHSHDHSHSHDHGHAHHHGHSNDHGHSHHHGHSHSHGHHHHHDEQIRLSNLFTLGVSGGLVPCDDAVVLLLAAIGAGLLTQAVYILLAFSGGLAAVLVLIGILVVKVKGFATRRPSTGKWLFRLQIASAAFITLIGAGICLSVI